MKNIICLALLLAACHPRNRDGTYVNHSEGQFSIADDTLIITDTVVINRAGYQKIRNGHLWPKAFKKRIWNLHSPDAPVMQITDAQIQIGNTIYDKVP